MKIFNENGDFLGEFTEAAEEVIENTKDMVYSWFEAGICLGIIGLLISPFWAILAIVTILLLKFVVEVIKFVLNCIWWTIRLPFSLIFKHEFPEL